MRKLYSVVLARHGQSIWNHDSKFTGWTNIPLTDYGRRDAYDISQCLKQYKLIPTIFFSSVLDRSIETAKIVKKHINPKKTLFTSWRLNEKHYGTLEGINRSYIREEYGDKFTNMMRNNFYMKPPVLNNLPNDYEEGKYSIFKNCYYNSIKYGESKENVLQRLLPYFENDILYTLTDNELPIVVTHKHCIRVLMKHYLQLNDNEFETFNVSEKNLIIFYFDDNFKYVKYNVISY